ncbi:MAG: hypothetical protein ABS87_07455 [Sphingomonas sp. SCN 67-18]|uniref:DUF423 domain-containing protein n=1 Tax=uncultured Sphingomonas sp. TaxID=158754 RepID=UPI00086DEA04|nr:DUF423 domain-containing protein [Sphingomonas sp. SCN 67-18]ODU21202.1 MAG: hypothetical protein ABS87_07455 [Sphingomonas sp. SCN 67-18]
MTAEHDRLLPWAALSAALAVAAGAFGAHGAEGAAADWLRTGASYQLVHAVAVIALGGRRTGEGPAALLLAGAMLFAATLYAIALGAPRWLGAVTPIGGAAMIGGWIWIAARGFRR